MENISYIVTVNDGTSTQSSGAVSLTVYPLPPTPVITFTGGSLTSSSAIGNQWYLNDASIPGATDPVYTPSASGNHYVIVSDLVSSCPSLPSNSINFLMTGIDPVSMDRLVSVYPNPFRDKITISYILQEACTVKISLFDAFGKEVRVIWNPERQSSGKHQVEMAAGNLDNGVYILKIQTLSYTVSKKILLTY
jgi:hypothetical protein